MSEEAIDINFGTDDAWQMELDTALLEGCTTSDIFTICQGRTLPDHLRAEVWQICLDVQDKADQVCHFNEIFDLPNQTRLRDDCKQAVEKLGHDDETDKLSICSDLESIITFYCKCRKLTYETNNGWIAILLPLLALKLPKSRTYNLFEAICDAYIPKVRNKNTAPFHVLRLLLQYHDPELCSFLDTKRVTLDLICQSWFQSLFACTFSLPVVFSMWDLYFQQSDPFFIFFLALVMISNARDKIIAMKAETKEKFVETLANMPTAMDVGDVTDFCAIAQYYAVKTPVTFKIDLLQTLYRNAMNDTDDTMMISQMLCLPVTAQELIENVSMDIAPDMDAVRFFLVDCRPAEQYNAGHLPTAFHLDSNLMLQEPSEFATAVQGLLNSQRQALASNSSAGGEHLCFVGSGRADEDQYTHMVVASFLQKHTQYVSMLVGGYKAIHDYYGDEVAACLQDHNSQLCICCSENGVSNNGAKTSQVPSAKIATIKSSQSIDLFGKISAVMKSKSVEVKDKLIDYIVNPNSSSSLDLESSTRTLTNRNPTRHVSDSEKDTGRRYRDVPPVFSIDDDYSASTTHQPPRDDSYELVPIPGWWKEGYAGNVISTFKCDEVKVSGHMFESHLIVTDTDLIVLRVLHTSDARISNMYKNKRLNNSLGYAQISARRPLSTIVKITAKKRHPNLITFKYGITDNGEVLETDMDKFLIEKASVATQLISAQIVNYLNSTAKHDDDD